MVSRSYAADLYLQLGFFLVWPHGISTHLWSGSSLQIPHSNIIYPSHFPLYIMHLQARVLRLQVGYIFFKFVYFLFFPRSFFLIVLFMPSIKSVKLILEDEASSFSGQSIRFDFSKWCENCSRRALRFSFYLNWIKFEDLCVALSRVQRKDQMRLLRRRL